MKKAYFILSAVILFSLINVSLALANTNFVAAVINQDRNPVGGAEVLLYKNGNLIPDYFCYTEDTGFCNVNFDPGLDASTLYWAGTSYPNNPPFGSNWAFTTDANGNGKVTICPDGFGLPECDAIPPTYSNVNGPGSVYSPTATYNFNITWADENAVDTVILELDGQNYTVTGNGFYSKTFTGLSAGSHNYRWYANDTADNWASTGSMSFTVSKATPSFSTSVTTPIIYGTASNYAGSESNSGDNDCAYILLRNGIQIATGSSVSDNTILGVGIWNYTYYTTGCSNYTSNKDEKLLTVNKASRTCSLSTDKGWTRTYDGTPSSTTCSVSAGSSDGSMTFTKNSNPISTPDSQTNAGTFNYACQWTGGTNYYDCTQQTNTLTINKANPTCTLSSTSGWTYTYGASTTLSCSCSGDGTTNLYFNGALHNDYNNQNIIFAANPTGYSVVCNTTAGTNYNSASASNTLTIGKATPSLSLSNNISWSGTYPSPTLTSGNSCPSQISCNLYRNNGGSIQVSNPDAVLLNAGSYTYVYNTTGNQNYSAATTSHALTINKANPILSGSVTTPINYGTASNYAGSESNSGDSDCTYALLRNGIQMASGSSVSDTAVLAAGTYNYTYYTSGCTNYNSGKDEKILVVNKATPSGSLTSDKGWNIVVGTTVTIGYSESNSGDADVTYKVWRDGVDKGSGETWTPPTGTYQYKLNTTGGTNFTARDNMDVKTLVVSNTQDTTPPQYLIITKPADPSYNFQAPYNFTINWTDNSKVDKVILQMDGTNYTLTGSGNTYSMTFSLCSSPSGGVGGGGGGGHFYMLSVGPIIPILFLISIFLSFVLRIKKKYNILSVLLIALFINLFFVAISGADTSPCLYYGNHLYRWYADDTSGNWNSTGTFGVTILNGNDPISIYIYSPKNITYSTNSVDVKYSIDSPFEISWIGYSLDNKANVTLTNNITLNLAEGSHNMIFYSNTTWGVMNNSQRVYFTVSLPKPDLIIGDIWTSGNTISYNIKNQGNANAGYSYSNLYVDNVYKANDYVVALSSGSSSNEYFSYSWACSGSSDSIQVCADANSNVVEGNENNNCLTKTVTCPVCTCTAWINTGDLCTGMINGCYYKYVRTCPNGCDTQSKCVYGGKYCAV